MTTGVRAVFFDSGGTLTLPTHQSWWPKPRFEELVAAAGFPPPAEGAARIALAEGAGYLARRPHLADVAQETEAYVEFYRIVLRRLFGCASDDLTARLAVAAVHDLDQEPYPDVIPTLDRLREAGVVTGIVSNAGPSLELRYRDMGLRDRLDPFVLSAVVGVEKPSRGIYLRALEEAGLAPEQVVFVDDVGDNVVAAARLGMRGYVIDRDGRGATSPDLATVGDLDELLAAAGLGPLRPGSQVELRTARRA